MDFIQISLPNLDGEAAETVSELFNRYGYGGAVIESEPDVAGVTVRTVTPADDPDRLRLIETMLALIGAALPHGLPDPRLEKVGESDWAEGWKEHFQPVRVGQRFVIKPTWRDYSPAPGDHIIELDPGLAFGSGLHPTTQLCINILETQLGPLPGHSLLDVGTGSGILTLVAAHLGAAPIRAVDIDPVAIRVAEENFTRNRLADIQTAVGSADAPGGRAWDIVLANILAPILIEIMPALAAALAPRGRLILSGLLTEQEPAITEAAAAQHLHPLSRHTQEDWAALVVSRGQVPGP